MEFGFIKMVVERVMLNSNVVAAFFSILHSWFNAFAEMLRFADRLFYKVRDAVFV